MIALLTCSMPYRQMPMKIALSGKSENIVPSFISATVSKILQPNWNKIHSNLDWNSYSS